jgi:putative transposase
MGKPYSEDLRERALARADTGEGVRAIAAAFGISPSCISKWKTRRRETGSFSPGKMGGYKKRVLAGENAEWLRERMKLDRFTTRQLVAELALRGIKTDRRAVWVFLQAEKLSFKKNDAGE